jgi:hypothetical protein
MEDYLEIDIKKIIKNIISKWYWVIIPAILIGLSTFLCFYQKPDIYRVTSQFIIVDPPYTANFESRYETTHPEPPSEDALKSIVLNNTIVTTLYELWDCEDKENCSINDFKEDHLFVNFGENSMLTSLSVETESRENATLLVNKWVALSMAAVESSYYGLDQTTVEYITDQVSIVEEQLREASDNIMLFKEQEDVRELLENEKNSLLAGQQEKLREIRALETVQIDIRNLIAQLAFEDDTASLDQSYRLSYLLIQSRVYSGLIWEDAPVQLLVETAPGAETKTVGEFRSMLENWLSVTDEKTDQLQEDQEVLNEQVLALSGEIQSLSREYDELIQEYARNKEIYNIVNKKYQEIQLTMPDDESSHVKLVSQAIVPEPDDRLPHNTVRNTAIGLVAGGFLGLAGVVIADWWKTTDDTEEPESEY